MIEGNPDELRNYGTSAHSSADRANGAVSDVLNIRRSVAGALVGPGAGAIDTVTHALAGSHGQYSQINEQLGHMTHRLADIVEEAQRADKAAGLAQHNLEHATTRLNNARDFLRGARDGGLPQAQVDKAQASVTAAERQHAADEAVFTAAAKTAQAADDHRRSFIHQYGAFCHEAAVKMHTTIQSIYQQAERLAPPKVAKEASPTINALITDYKQARELMLSYKNGYIGNNWWQQATNLDAIETYFQTTGDKEFNYAIQGAFSHGDRSKGSEYVDGKTGYLDDTAWWALDWLQAYHITGQRKYLTAAQQDARFMNASWNKNGGGLWWRNVSNNYDRTPGALKFFGLNNFPGFTHIKTVPATYKGAGNNYINSIPNGLFLNLTSGLYNTTHNPQDLAWATREARWMQSSGLIDKSGLVHDGLVPGKNGQYSPGNWQVNGRGYTYNQGEALSGLANLYQGTGNPAYLAEAGRIAHQTVTSNLTTTPHGILFDPKTHDQDFQSFKGPGIAGLSNYVNADPSAQNLHGFISNQATSIQQHDSNANNQIGYDWGGPPPNTAHPGTASSANPNPSTANTQASGLDATNAALSTDGT